MLEKHIHGFISVYVQYKQADKMYELQNKIPWKIN
jgi:hypothetical protein